MTGTLAPVVPIEGVTTLCEGLDHPECVIWDPTTGCYYAGGEAGQVYRVTETGEVTELATTGGFILGLALDGAGRLYVCDLKRSSVFAVDTSTGEVTLISSGTHDRQMRTPNYLCFDALGNLYVTDSGIYGNHDGLIFRINSDGQTEVWTQALPRFPNGCCIGVGGTSLWVVESLAPGVREVPILADGSAGPLGPLRELPGAIPDGIAIDSAGSVYVGCYRPDRIYRVHRDGATEIVADDPTGGQLAAPTNIAFAGPGLRRIAVASLGRWHIATFDVPVPGSPLHYPTGPRTGTE